MFENKNSRTELNQLGEFGLIQYIKDNVTLSQPGSLTGIGDDAAVIDNGPGRTVITTDMLLEGVHFDLSYCPLKHLGYKSVVVNVSDLCAMNATPRQIVIGLGLSNRFSLDAIEEFYAGVMLACERYGVDLVGGDTTSSKSGMVISITAIGSAPQEELIYRNGAKENDLICVTGDLGAAYMGLQLLNREKQIYLENPQAQPDLQGYDYILERQLKPEARLDIIRRFKTWYIQPTSMIDISDGLASEILHICKASNKGCQIYEEKLPIDHLTRELGMELGIDATVAALNGGEDYELLFTLPISEYEKIKDRAEISIVGHITDVNAGYQFVDRQNGVHPLTAQGWDAFLSK
ncbi:MAG TPA: thiamine-phosphate kinase [Bacteroidia bacterium]|jgi:thiamine-monophosphate kinase|nr:thiamine-phosphate kinase [Bacteroidia bacterium]HQK97791.1 thiamine-phosphate kinase [Bacteroidia bacterium]